MKAPASPGERLRRLCLALPETTEVVMKRGPSYRVGDKIFALERASGEGVALWCKAPHGGQQIAVGSDPARFFIPPYFGVKGWIGLRLTDDVDWAEVAAFVRRAYRLIAPRRLAEALPP